MADAKTKALSLPPRAWDLIEKHAAASRLALADAAAELIVEGFKAHSPAWGQDLVTRSVPLLEVIAAPPRKFVPPKG